MKTLNTELVKVLNVLRRKKIISLAYFFIAVTLFFASFAISRVSWIDPETGTVLVVFGFLYLFHFCYAFFLFPLRYKGIVKNYYSWPINITSKLSFVDQSGNRALFTAILLAVSFVVLINWKEIPDNFVTKVVLGISGWLPLNYLLAKLTSTNKMFTDKFFLIDMKTLFPDKIVKKSGKKIVVKIADEEYADFLEVYFIAPISVSESSLHLLITTSFLKYLEEREKKLKRSNEKGKKAKARATVLAQKVKASMSYTGTN